MVRPAWFLSTSFVGRAVPDDGGPKAVFVPDVCPPTGSTAVFIGLMRLRPVVRGPCLCQPYARCRRSRLQRSVIGEPYVCRPYRRSVRFRPLCLAMYCREYFVDGVFAVWCFAVRICRRCSRRRPLYRRRCAFSAYGASFTHPSRSPAVWWTNGVAVPRSLHDPGRGSVCHRRALCTAWATDRVPGDMRPAGALWAACRRSGPQGRYRRRRWAPRRGDGSHAAERRADGVSHCDARASQCLMPFSFSHAPTARPCV